MPLDISFQEDNMKKSARMSLPFLVLLIVVMGCTKLGRQPQGRYQQQLKVAEVLNAKFDLSAKATVDQTVKGIRFDCKFKFFVDVEDDKVTLVVYFCESTSTATKERKLAEVLTPENAALIKDAGFEQVKLYDRFADQLLDRVDVR